MAGLSPAQVANQLTWQLKGDLKNIQLSYIRAAVALNTSSAGQRPGTRA